MKGQRRAALLLVSVNVVMMLLMAAIDTPLHDASPWVRLAVAGALLVALSVGALVWRLGRRLEAEQARRDAEAALHREVLDALQIGLVLYDAEDRLVLCNRDFRQLYQSFAHRLIPGTPFQTLLRAAVEHGELPDVPPAERQAWLAGRLAQHRSPQAPFMRRLGSGRWRRIVEQRLADGSILAHSMDVTELVHRGELLQQLNAQLDRANGELSRLSETDVLTGLANRRHFDRRLHEEWDRARRHGLPLALLMLDVDHFKRFNDRHGHPAGDTCLRQVAAVLRRSVHRPADLVARVGGEEFAILLPHLDGSEAAVVAQRCQHNLATEQLLHGDSPAGPHVTLSIGMAHLGELAEGTTADALVAMADGAMYRAKRQGRSQVAGAAAPPPLAIGPTRPWSQS